MNREQRECHGRGRERLGRYDGDLRSGVQIDAASAFASNGAADDIDDAEHTATFALYLLDRGKRVERFTGLADGDVQRVLLDHRIAITKLRGGLGMRRHTSELFDQVRTNAASDVGRAATENLHAADLQQLAR